MTRLDLDGWSVELVDRDGLPQLGRLRIRGVPVGARRSVFEYAVQIGTTWTGNGHCHEQPGTLDRDGNGWVRTSTLLHPDGQPMAASEVRYLPTDAGLEVRRSVRWLREVTVRRHFVAMFPLGPTFLRRDGGWVRIGGREQLHARTEAMSLTSPVLRARATLELLDLATVNGWERSAPTFMAVDSRKWGDQVKLYVARSTGKNPEDVADGEVHTAAVRYSITRGSRRRGR
jgi:hypothetical protein